MLMRDYNVTSFVHLYNMIRLLKENRAAGVVDNFEEGEREQGPRKFISHRPPEIFPSVHNFFCRPDLP